MFTIKDIIWVDPNDMNAGRSEGGKKDYICDSQHFQILGDPFHNLLTVLGTLEKNLLRDTPIILLRKIYMGIIEDHRS